MATNEKNVDTAVRHLGSVGERGIVLHYGGAPERRSNHYAYSPDNREDGWRKYPVKDIGVFAKEHGFSETDLTVLLDNSAATAALPDKKHKNHETVLVNLDAFRTLPEREADRPAGGAHPKGKDHFPINFGALLIHEKKHFYSPPNEALYPLDEADAGEAVPLVRRGAVAAAIPNNDIPIGTDCVLVNLSEILPHPHPHG